MLILKCRAGKENWEEGIIHPEVVIVGRELKRLLEWTEEQERLHAKPERVSRQKLTLRTPDQEGASSSLIVMDDDADDMHQLVHVIKLCPCAQALLRRSSHWKRALMIRMDGYLLSCVIRTAKYSSVYRESLVRTILTHAVVVSQSLTIPCKVDANVTSPVLRQHLQVRVRLAEPVHHIMDVGWNNRLQILIEERCELDYMMAWLSTLGGAYSALGDNFQHCAETAGKISGQQLKIALKLGDPITASKCMVYYAISLVQRGYWQQTAHLIRQQYRYAKSLPENVRDVRLINMCKGVWAKLQYVHSQRRPSITGSVNGQSC